jgi:hypothetical protein
MSFKGDVFSTAAALWVGFMLKCVAVKGHPVHFLALSPALGGYRYFASVGAVRHGYLAAKTITHTFVFVSKTIHLKA